MQNFTPLASTLGGLLIGLSAALLLLTVGRIAGISGIFGGLLLPRTSDRGWRLSFVLGLLVGGASMALARPELFTNRLDVALPVVAVAGLLVGFGTRMGDGCTSGHGVCGISRGSARSIAATATFMLAAAITVFFVRHVFGGGS